MTNWGYVRMVFLVVGLLFASVGVYGCAVVFSRINFDRYVRLHHPDVWHRLRSGRHPAFLATDATREMAKFRSRVDDDLGDGRLRRMKLTSRWLYWCAVGLWVLAAMALIGLTLGASS